MKTRKKEFIVTISYQVTVNEGTPLDAALAAGSKQVSDCTPLYRVSRYLRGKFVEMGTFTEKELRANS